eukprot:Pgem_evm1s6565
MAVHMAPVAHQAGVAGSHMATQAVHAISTGWTNAGHAANAGMAQLQQGTSAAWTQASTQIHQTATAAMHNPAAKVVGDLAHGEL